MPSRQPAITVFAIAFVVVLIAAIVTTLERVDTRQVRNDVPPGTVGLALPHPPLDKAPGQAVR
jgi:hypothetical protein